MSIYREDHEEKSHIPISSAFLKWRIQGFDHWTDTNGQIIESKSIFCCSGRWKIFIYPRMLNMDSDREYIVIFIAYNGRRRIKARLKAYLKDYENQDHYLAEQTFNFEKAGDVAKWENFAVTEDVLVEKRKELCPNDVLTVCFEISALGKVDSTTMKPNTHVPVSGDFKTLDLDCSNTLSKTFEALYQAQTLNDLTVKICHQEFAVHKMILAAHSYLLLNDFLLLKHRDDSITADCSKTTKLELSLIELTANRRVIKLRHIPPSVASDFIYYMYTGKVNNMSMEKARDLLLTANKYCMLHLENSCRHYISENLSVSNFPGLLNISDSKDRSNIMDAEVFKKFYDMNYKDLTLKTDWNEQKMTHRYSEVVESEEKSENTYTLLYKTDLI